MERATSGSPSQRAMLLGSSLHHLRRPRSLPGSNGEQPIILASVPALFHVILSSTSMEISGLPKPWERSAFSTPLHTLLSKRPFQLLPAIHMVLRMILQRILSGLERITTPCWAISHLHKLEPLLSKSILLAQQYMRTWLPSMLREMFGT